MFSTYRISCLERSTNSSFFAKPTMLSVDEELVTKYSSSQKVETLIEELQKNGPLVGLGKFGPSFYAEGALFKLSDKLCDQEIHGWKPGTRLEGSGNNSIIVLGAKKEGDRGLVYFTLSDDITSKRDSYHRTHLPSSTDTKIYVVSHKTFQNYLNDLYLPPFTADPDSDLARACLYPSRPSTAAALAPRSSVVPASVPDTDRDESHVLPPTQLPRLSVSQLEDLNRQMAEGIDEFSRLLPSRNRDLGASFAFASTRMGWEIVDKHKCEAELSASQKEYVNKLSSFPLDSIIDRGEGERTCKALGQEIFDRYKQESGENTLYGRDAAVKICVALRSMASDGDLRKQYVERAWEGIGDEQWDWRA